jgi:hypothetical protein
MLWGVATLSVVTMPFPESLKLRVRQRAHFACCVCHALGVEVHHIVPESDDGPSDDANAAPLCPTCHETYGANPVKRKFIREARDTWYGICERRYASDPDRLTGVEKALEATATRSDLDRAVERLINVLEPRAFARDGTETPAAPEDAELTPSTLRNLLRMLYSTVRHCGAERTSQLSNALRASGYKTVGEVEAALIDTVEPVADFVASYRDRGDPTDWFVDDHAPQLLLPFLDEVFCLVNRPSVHAKLVSSARWVRRIGDPPPRTVRSTPPKPVVSESRDDV